VRKTFAIFLLATVAAFARIANATPITYTIEPTVLSGGYTLTGTITTDGTIGAIAASDISSWAWTVTGPNTFSQSGLEPATNSVIEGLMATTSELYIPFADPPPFPQDAMGGQVFLSNSTTSHLEFATFTSWDQNPTVLSFQSVVDIGAPAPVSFARQLNDFGSVQPSGPMVVAVATPEPSALVLAGLGIAGLLFAARRRRV
jgi:PEP-CTERM motif